MPTSARANRRPLLLAAGHLVGELGGVVAQAHAVERRGHAAAALGRLDTVEQQRHLDVLGGVAWGSRPEPGPRTRNARRRERGRARARAACPSRRPHARHAVVGRSRPAREEQQRALPEPLGPVTATVCPPRR